MDRDMNPQDPKDQEPIVPAIDPTIQALLDRINELETKLTARPTSTNAPREICKRNHATDNWKVTPKGVRYCVLCYKELRLEQAERKLRELGRIS